MKSKNFIENLLVYVFFCIFLVIGYSALSGSEEDSGNLLKVNYLNVGQGDATLIEIPGKEYILIDGGPDKSILAELGEILPPHERRIDVLILSHPHADHLAGFNYILDRYEVGKIYMTGATNNTPDFVTFLEKIKENRIQTEILTSGEDICYEAVCMDVLWPDAGEISKYDLNDTSMIINLHYYESDFVFLGDVSASIQDKIVERFDFDAEIIKISHHGSKTGTSKKIINKINPEISVISSGENNYFNHPAESVLNILSGRVVLRTDQLGTITIKSDGNTIQY